jgi:hypothetical protein
MLVAAELSKALRKAGFTPEFGDEYLNIARADGVHCEFYGQRGTDYVIASATYEINGAETDLDFFIVSEDEIFDFVFTVNKILNG